MYFLLLQNTKTCYYLYYPIDSDSFLTNVFIIYPPPHGLLLIFFILIKKMVVKIHKIYFVLSITLLLGIPFFIIKIMFVLIYTRSRIRA